MIRLGVLIFVIVVLVERTNALSREQLKKTAKGMKKSCMNKIQVTEDMIGEIEKGKFIEDKKVMCYISCVYEMMNVVKNNKISYEACVKQVETMYPPEIKASAKAAVDHCKDIPKRYKDICEASYYSAKCMYEFKPEDFIFP